MIEWIKQIEKGFSQLKGEAAVKWDCVEMALSEDPVQWYSPDIEYLQCARVDIHLENGKTFSLMTYQDDDEFGLFINMDMPPVNIVESPESIFRYRELVELPAGLITEVSIKKNPSGNIAALDLFVNENKVSFIAAEVDLHPDGSYCIREMDESILIQVNGKRP